MWSDLEPFSRCESSRSSGKLALVFQKRRSHTKCVCTVIPTLRYFCHAGFREMSCLNNLSRTLFTCVHLAFGVGKWLSLRALPWFAISNADLMQYRAVNRVSKHGAEVGHCFINSAADSFILYSFKFVTSNVVGAKMSVALRISHHFASILQYVAAYFTRQFTKREPRPRNSRPCLHLQKSLKSESEVKTGVAIV